MKVGTLAGILGFLILVVGATVSTVTFFQSKSTAQEQHMRISERSEVERLRLQLDLVLMKIDYLVKQSEKEALNADEQNELDFLRTQRDTMQAEIRSIQRG